MTLDALLKGITGVGSYFLPSNPQALTETDQKIVGIKEENLAENTGLNQSSIGLKEKLGLSYVGVRLNGRGTEAKSYLSNLTNSDIVSSLGRFDRVINDVIRDFMPTDIENYMGEKSVDLTNCLLPIFIANLSKAAFPDSATKVSLEVLTTGIIKKTLKDILDQLYKIDSAIANGEPYNPALFVNFEETVLKLLLPKEGSTWQKMEIHFLSNQLRGKIATLLYEMYSKFLINAFPINLKNSLQKPADAPPAGIWNRVEPYTHEIIIHCLYSLATTTIEEETQYFLKFDNKDISTVLDLFMQPLMQPLKKWIYPQLPTFLTGLKDEEFQQILKALLLKLIGNILRSYNDLPQKLSSDAILKYLFEYFKCLMHSEFKRINELETKAVIESKDYEPIIEKLLCTILHDRSLAGWILKKFPMIKNLGTEFLFDLHHKLKADSSEFYKNQLREFLWDEKSFKELWRCPDAVSIPTDRAARAEIIGTEKIVTQIYLLAQNIAKATVDTLVLKGQDPHLQKKIFNTLIETINLESNPLIYQSFKVSFDIFLNEDIVNRAIRDFVKKWLGDTFFKWIVILIEKGGEMEGVKSRDRALFFAVKFLLKSVKGHIESIQQSFEVDEQNKDDQNQSFGNLAKALTKILKGEEGHFPLPDVMNKYLTKELRKSWLPSLMAYFYKGFSVEIYNTQDYIDQLAKIYHTHRTSEMMHFLSQYVMQFTPNHLLHHSETLAELSLNPLSIILPLPQDELKVMKTLFEGLFHGLGECQDQEIKMVFVFLQKYVEALLLKSVLHFSNSNKRESEDKKERLAVEISEITKEHFKEINIYKDENGQEHASKIPYEKMRLHFEKKKIFHRALKDSAGKKEFNEKITKDILLIFNIKEEIGLPAPSILQPTLWLLVIEMLMPIVVEQLFTLIMEPHSLHKYLQALLTSINSSLKVTNEKINAFSYSKPADPTQEKLEDILGSLIVELVGLQPMLFKKSFSAFKGKVGQESAASFRRMIKRDSLLKLFEQLVELIALMHRGGWVNAINYNVCKHSNTMPPLDPNGDVFIPLKEDNTIGWDFQLPKTKEEQLKLERAKTELHQQTKDSVQKELSGMIERQAYLSFQAALNELWRQFQENFDHSAYSNFGDFGAKVKHVLDKICQFVWRYILSPILTITTYPLRKVSKMIFKQYCNNQARMRVGDIESAINNNLMLNALERIIETFAVSQPA